MTIMELRYKLIELVRDGRIERRQYDALFEVLCATHINMPWHQDDVAQSILLVSNLLDQIAAK